MVFDHGGFAMSIESIVRIPVRPSLFLPALTLAAAVFGAPAPLRSADRPPTISGKVVDWEGIPVPGATVSIRETGTSEETDVSGHFEMDQVPPGECHLDVEKDGYAPYSSGLLAPDKNLTVDVVLMKTYREEVVVTATRTEGRLMDIPIRTELIPARDIVESGAKNLHEVLDKRLVPGVWVETSCTNCNFSSIRMQGLESGYCGLLFDGQPIFSALAGVYGLNQILPENIERIEVVKGAGSALYGSSAIGGVINIITKEPLRDTPQFNSIASYGDHDTYDVGSTFSLRKGNVASILTAQKHKNDYADETGPEGIPDDYTDKVEQDNSSISLKNHFYLAKDKHRLTLLGRSLHEFRRGGYIPGGHSVEDESGNVIGYTRGIDDAMDPDAEHITTDRREYGFGYNGLLPSGGMLTVNLLRTGHEREATNGERPFYSEEVISLADAVYSHPLKAHVITTGVNYSEEALDQRVNWTEAPRTTSRTLGIFAQDELKPRANIGVVLGVRYDNVKSSLSEDAALSPRLAVKWDVSSTFNLRGSVGAGFKVPHLFAEDLHLCSAAPLIVVSLDVEPEQAWSYNFSGTYARAHATIDVSLFRTDIKKKIALDYHEAENVGYYDNAGDAYTQGVEASAAFRLPRPSLKFEIALTYTDARFKDKLDPAFEHSDRIMRVPDKTARFGLEYHAPRLGLKVNCSGRVIGRQYVEREMIIEGQDELEYHIDHVDAYTVWDARITKDIWKGNCFAYLGVDNIFNTIQSPLYNAEQEDTAAYIYAPTTGTYVYGGVRIRF
jgi:outer membrane receptor for ferrienterochelin and colicins